MRSNPVGPLKQVLGCVNPCLVLAFSGMNMMASSRNLWPFPFAFPAERVGKGKKDDHQLDIGPMGNVSQRLLYNSIVLRLAKSEWPKVHMSRRGCVGLTPAVARGSQETRFTQPLRDKNAVLGTRRAGWLRVHCLPPPQHELGLLSFLSQPSWQRTICICAASQVFLAMAVPND